MSYANLVSKKKQYKYSANICFDLKDEEKLAGFIPNVTTTEILKEYLLGVINGASSPHSRILYGSYGTGKSHLLTVLSDLLGHINTSGNGLKEFLKAISKYDADFAKEIKRFTEREKPYLIVPIYSYFDDFDKCIMFSLKEVLEKNSIDICFKSYFDDALQLINLWKNGVDSHSRLSAICDANNVNLEELSSGLQNYQSSSEKCFANIFKAMTYGAEFVSDNGNMLDNISMANEAIKENYQGIVFIFDEFGRYIEDAGETIRVKDIQDLAEFCDHSDYDNYLFLVSHKQLSLYTDSMKKSLSDEWKKIEGRFKSTSINIKYDQCLSLISHIIPKTKNWESFKKKYERELNELYTQAYEFKGFLLPPEDGATNPFEGGFPLHPITLYSLDRLSKKVAQNERTFFTFLAGDEEYSLFSQLSKVPLDEFHFIGLDTLYDYFEENICSYRSEAKDIYKKFQVALNKLGNTPDNVLEIKILKAIAVINIINDTSTITADAITLMNVIDSQKNDIEMAIKKLETNKIIKYMRQYGYYDFLDSSIYDFDSMIEERIPSITDEMAVSILNEEFSNFVLYPYKYNLDYHMNRIVLPVFALKNDVSKKALLRFVPKYYDGIAAFILDKQYDPSDYLCFDTIPDRTVMIINRNAVNVLYEVKRYLAIKYFYSIRSELMKDDPTVEQELTLYIDEQRGILYDIVDSWKKVNSNNYVVISDGMEYDIKNERELSNLISEIMYDNFSKTIIINNDLINKNNISGAIKLARSKALMYIMENDNVFENCSLMSPEHTIIRSVLSKNGLLEDDTCGIYNVLPDGEMSGAQVKNEITKYIKNCTKGPVMFKELYDKLKKAPYGLRDGYISILIAYELRSFKNISIYFHGSEHDYCGDELIKALDNPDDYSLYICNWTSAQESYILGLEDIFKAFVSKDAKNRLKELFEAMNKHFVTISKSARTTNKYVSEDTKHYRDIMSVTCKDYNKFFFEVLPQINSDLQMLVVQMQNIIKELHCVTELQLETLEKAVRTALNLKKEDAISQYLSVKFEDEWKSKMFKSFDYQTSAMLDYLSTMNPEISDLEIIKELGRIVTGFEVEYWNDSKVEDFYETFTKMITQLDDYVVSSSVGDNEVKVTINTGNEEEKVTQFNKTELSGTSQMMFNKMKSTIENFGSSISQEEKMQVLAKLFTEIM